MKKIFTLLAITFIAFNLRAVAQTNTTCNAEFSFTISGNSVQFIPVATIDSQLVYHSWSFGDGSAVQNTYAPSHLYSGPGTYTVIDYLTRLSPNKAVVCADTVKEQVVIPATTCDFSIGYTWKLDSLNHFKVYFTNTSPINTAASVRWYFSDNTTTYDSTWNTTHTFANAGKYNVCLRIQLNPNCVKYQCDTITIPAPVTCNIQSYFYGAIDSSHFNVVHFTNYTQNLLTTDSTIWSFGDGTSSKDINPTHTFANAGTYNVCLYVKRLLVPGAAPCVSQFCRTITITQPCNLTVNFKDSIITAPYTYKFTNLTTGLSSTDSSYWVFGDGTSSHDISPTHTFAAAGTFNVCLYIKRATTNSSSTPCTGSICKTFVITQPCDFKISYTWKVDSLNHNKVYFSGITTTSATASIRWSFGDNTPLDSSGWNPTHVFANAGKYYVCLRVQLTPNCVQYHCDTVIVPVTPPACNIQAYFNSTVDSLHSNVIHFHDYTVNLLLGDSTIWTFGDGTTSYDVSPDHTFANAGTYNVCLHVKRLTISGASPCVSEFCRSITVTIPVTCNLAAGFYYYKDTLGTSPVANLYHFINTSTPANDIDSSFWDFGDGTNISHDKNPTHAFAVPGTYTVCLYVKKVNITGTTPCISRICETVTIPAACNLLPSYTWKIDSANHLAVDFINTTKLSSTTGITVTWFFGDNTSASSWNTSHIYAQPGKYYVCLRVQTGADCIKYSCDSVTIPAPAVDCNHNSLFTFDHPATDNASYSFAPYAPDNGIQYTWTFGDGTGSLDEFSSHHYAKPGIYVACLTAYRNANCASTTCKAIKVRQPINCDSIRIYYNYYRSGSASNKVYFYTALNFPLIQQTWTITNLSNLIDSPVIIHQNNLVYTFNDTGYYNICLKAITAGGCTKEYCNTIHIDAIATPCELYAYPNPVHTQVSVNVQLNAPEIIHAFLYNSQNTLILQSQQQGTTGTNMVTLKTDNLSAGVYTVKFIYGDRTCFAKFEKL